MTHAAYTRANLELTEGDIPLPRNRWDDLLIQFALSFDGYQYAANQPGNSLVGKLAGLARPIVRGFAETGSLPSSLSLSDLRACVFWEQRRDRHAARWEIEGKQFDYMRALLAAIRAKIRAREID